MASKNTKARNRNAIITDAPISFPFKGLTCQRELLLRRLTPSDQYEFLKWIQSQAKPTASLPFRPEELAAMRDEDRLAVLKSFAAERAKLPNPPEAKITDAQIFEVMYTPEGVARTVWIYARKLQPDLTLEFYRSEITKDNFEQIDSELKVLIQDEDDEDDDNPK